MIAAAEYPAIGIQLPARCADNRQSSCVSYPQVIQSMFEFDFGHGEDLDLLRDTVRSFARDHIAPRAAEIDEKNEFPRDLWPQLGALGLLGITVEETYGVS